MDELQISNQRLKTARENYERRYNAQILKLEREHKTHTANLDAKVADLDEGARSAGAIE